MKVATCWDDGVVNDMRLAEIFRKHHLKATFNINPGRLKRNERSAGWGAFIGNDGSREPFTVWVQSLVEMKETYRGFQVASHTMTHPAATSIPPEAFLKEAVDARKFIEDEFQIESRGFAWPCGVDTDETCKLLAAAGFAYGRTTKTTDDVMSYSDPMRLTPNTHFMSPYFWRRFERARKFGAFYFWGHSYELADDDALWQDFEDKIARICSMPEVEFVDVIDLVKV